MNASTDLPAPAEPAEPSRGACANCGTPLQGDFCHACGQPVKGLVRHFSSIVGDVLDSVFEWDSRTPRTLWPLLARPGYLSLEYFAGRRVRYVSPFRLFFFLAVVAFFVGRLVISFDDGSAIHVSRSDDRIEAARTVEEVERVRDEALAQVEAARARLPADGGTATAGTRAALAASETAIRTRASERIARIEAEAAGTAPPRRKERPRISFNSEEWDPVTNPLKIDGLPDFANDWLNRQVGRAERNVQRLQEEPDLLKDSLLGAVPSTLFVLLPIFALMLKVAYLFRRRLYMEHLIVAMHSHAFVFLVLLLVFTMMALEHWLAPGGGPLARVFGVAEGLLWLWIPVYLLLMQKRVYGQGWFMTLLKYFVIGTCYSILLSLGAAFTTVASLVWM
ncbi:Archaeal/vacuolar-type H+-ATPase subunit I [Luteimonas sp. J16]|uniref:DUF3667 domain-containing protein n=1 Tax=unclassified Luteimonas TaxID=2629088 RepID=UPI0004B5F97B|nr:MULTISPECIES: DUF3667 domain-containing protein [unclassified Luteimonas]TWG88388.1 Archaeal/vacuolar-type H+-ATPase subunit I [Luteimonas sp. J16]